MNVKLVDRLNTGWVICEAESDPDMRAHLEAHWIALLRQYEAACDASAAIDGFRNPMTAQQPHDGGRIAA